MSKEMRKVCPHCEERLAPRTLREHARLFFDARSRTWTKKKKISSAIEDNEIEKAAVFDDEEIRELQVYIKVLHGCVTCLDVIMLIVIIPRPIFVYPLN